MNEQYISFDFSDGYSTQNANPHHIRDGLWGGFGPSYWRHAERYGFQSGDVVEWDYERSHPVWKRIWVDAAKQWRGLTKDEKARLPELRKPDAPKWDKPISFPIDLKAAEAIAAVLKQPLSDVLEQAPMIRDIFDKKTQ